jgi:predicted metal-dependent phosphoesterase TrpH
MQNLPFNQPGHFWRGNIHTHSTVSDGQLTPEAVCNLYSELGYDFIALTDHFMALYDFPITDTRPLRTPDFTTILGAELHTGQTELGQLWHILAVGLPLDFAPSADDETGSQMAQRALDAGAYVAVAHPAWYTLTEADVISLGPVHAIETINGISADYNDRLDSWYMLDVMLARGYRYFACATDDTHFNLTRGDVEQGWVYVKSESLEPEALLAALKAGHNYCSSGPQLFDIQVEPGERISIRCSPVESIFVTGKGWYAHQRHGRSIREAEFSLKDFNSPYCRVTVRDENGKRAWSNPIWFE